MVRLSLGSVCGSVTDRESETKKRQRVRKRERKRERQRVLQFVPAVSGKYALQQGIPSKRSK